MLNSMEDRQNEQGYSLLTVFVTLVIISIIGISIIGITANTMKTMSSERDDQTVYYYAESGLVEKRALLYSEINSAYDDAVKDFKKQLEENAKKPPNLQTEINFKKIFKEKLEDKVNLSPITFDYLEQFSNKPVAEVTITSDIQGDSMIYTLKSIGKLHDTSSKTRIVTQDIKVNLNSASTTSPSPGGTASFAVYSRNNIAYAYYNIKDNVKGHLASASSTKVAVTGWEPEPIPITHDPTSFDILVNDVFQQQLNFDSNYFDNTHYSPSNSNLISNNSLEANNWNKYNNKTLTLTDNLKLNTFSTSSNMTFNIDVGNSDKILYVDNLKFDGTLNVLGSGNLTIYVKNTLNFNYSNININGNPDKLNIYYAGTEKITIANGLKLKANLFFKDANLEFSGGAGVSGSYYSNGYGKTTINGGTVANDVVFVMPNSDFTITGGANLKGSILCNEIFLAGGSKIDSTAGGGLGGGHTITIDEELPIQSGSQVEIDS